MGFDFNGRTAGIIGPGKIGSIVAHIQNGFDINLLTYDLVENEEALSNIVETTLQNISDFETRGQCVNEVHPLT